MSTQPIGLDGVLTRIQQIEAQQQQLLALPTSPAAVNTGAAAGATTTVASTGMGSAASGATASAGGSAFATLLSSLAGSGTGSSASSGPAAFTGTSAGTNSTLPPALTGTTAASFGTQSAFGALSSLAGSDPALLGVLAGLPTGTGAAAAAGAVGAADAAPAAVSAMTAEANALVGKPYVWGGGHGGWGPQPGYDCSGFVSAVLHAGGYLASPQDTQTLPSAAGIEAGPGQYVTIYDRTDAGLGADHVIIDLNGQFYESGGEAGSWGGGGGVQRIATPPASYLATFNQILHPAGL